MHAPARSTSFVLATHGSGSSARNPTSATRPESWLDQVAIVAAYRYRYEITANDPLGPQPTTIVQQCDADHAAAAVQHALEITSTQ